MPLRVELRRCPSVKGGEFLGEFLGRRIPRRIHRRILPRRIHRRSIPRSMALLHPSCHEPNNRWNGVVRISGRLLETSTSCWCVTCRFEVVWMAAPFLSHTGCGESTVGIGNHIKYRTFCGLSWLHWHRRCVLHVLILRLWLTRVESLSRGKEEQLLLSVRARMA